MVDLGTYSPKLAAPTTGKDLQEGVLFIAVLCVIMLVLGIALVAHYLVHLATCDPLLRRRCRVCEPQEEAGSWQEW